VSIACAPSKSGASKLRLRNVPKAVPIPEISLEHGVVVVGRDASCDVKLESDRVSRFHCCLAEDGHGRVSVRDLGSTNGTRINGRLVRLGRMSPGDELTVGDVTFRLGAPKAQKPFFADADSGSRILEDFEHCAIELAPAPLGVRNVAAAAVKHAEAASEIP
jgi:predicted component of type VI protein secretion system